MMSNEMARSNPEYAQNLLKIIWKTAKTPIRIMEVCGTHTMAIAKSGIKQLLPDTITLLSGPGCPVCVTDETDIDTACILADLPNVILATYGDMIRVPGSNYSLELARLKGADIRIIYSGRNALQLAVENPSCEVVLLSVGFETTAPTAAITLETALKENLNNFSVLSLHKAVTPILKFLLSDPELSIDAFILPGHVCVITGIGEFQFIVKEFARPCVVTGFEPIDILEAIVMLLYQQHRRNPAIEIQYPAVQKQGNRTARRYIDTYFDLRDCVWRGIGLVSDSGYAIKKAYHRLDAVNKFKIQAPPHKKTSCVCGEILKGKKSPAECKLFGISCTPSTPQGPCMVSQEGSCAAVYRFENRIRGNEQCTTHPLKSNSLTAMGAKKHSS